MDTGPPRTPDQIPAWRISPVQVFRIFLSSTFLDFRKERHLLHTLVFPALEKKFAHAGIELEVIDLRWGVNETDARTQDTLELCLDEILRCQRLTEKPNFLGLMGGRVGWRPLPNILGQNLYDALYELADDTGEKQVLETWYKPDITVLNNDARRFSALVEPGESVRILAPTTTDPEEKAAWARAEKTLRALFDAYSIRVLSHSGKRDSILALCASATFQEVMLGLRVVKNPIILLREDFCTQSGSDADSQMGKLLSTDMRDKLVRYFSRSDHQDDFSPGYWKFDTGFVLERLSMHVEELLHEHVSLPDAHRFFGENRCLPLYSFPGDETNHKPVFQGRQPTLDRLESLFTQDPTQSAVQIVTGNGGAGKTTLMAALVARLRKAKKGITPEPALHEYYVGATPDSLRLDRLEQDVSTWLSRTDTAPLWMVIDGLEHLGPHSLSRLRGTIESKAAEMEKNRERGKETATKRQFVLCVGIRSEDGTPADPDWSLPIKLPEEGWWPVRQETPVLRLSATDPDAPVAQDLLDALTATLKIPRRLNDTQPPGRRSLFLELLGDAPEPLAIRIAATLAFAPYPRIEETQVFCTRTSGQAWTLLEWVQAMLENAEHVGIREVSTAVVRMLALARFGLSRRELAGSISLIPGMKECISKSSHWKMEDIWTDMIPPVLVARVLGRLEPFLIETATTDLSGITIRYFHQKFTERLLTAPTGTSLPSLGTCRSALALWFDRVAHAWLHPSGQDTAPEQAWRHITPADLRALRQVSALLLDVAAAPEEKATCLTPRDALEKACAQLGDVAALGIRIAAGLLVEVIDDLRRLQQMSSSAVPPLPEFITPLLDILLQQGGYIQRLIVTPKMEDGTSAHETGIMQRFSMVVSRLMNVFLAERENTPLHAMAMHWLRGEGKTFRWLRHMAEAPSPLRVVCAPLDILADPNCRVKDICMRPQFPAGYGPGSEHAVIMWGIHTRSPTLRHNEYDGSIFMLLDARDGHERGRVTIGYPPTDAPSVAFYLLAMERDSRGIEQAWIGIKLSGGLDLCLLSLDQDHAAGQKMTTVLSLPPADQHRRLLFSAERRILAVEAQGAYSLYGPPEPTGPDKTLTLPLQAQKDAGSFEADGDTCIHRDAEGRETVFAYFSTLPGRKPESQPASQTIRPKKKRVTRPAGGDHLRDNAGSSPSDTGYRLFTLPDGASVWVCTSLVEEQSPGYPDDDAYYYVYKQSHVLRRPGETGPGLCLATAEWMQMDEPGGGVKVKVINGDMILVIQEDSIQVILPPYTAPLPRLPIQSYQYDKTILIRSQDGRRDEFVVRYGTDSDFATIQSLSICQLPSGPAYNVPLREIIAYGTQDNNDPLQSYDGGILILGMSGILYDLKLDTLDKDHDSSHSVMFDTCQWLDTDRMLLLATENMEMGTLLRSTVLQLDDWDKSGTPGITVTAEKDETTCGPGSTWGLSAYQPPKGALVVSSPEISDPSYQTLTPLVYYDRNGRQAGQYLLDWDAEDLYLSASLFFPMEGYPVLILSDEAQETKMAGWQAGVGLILPSSVRVTRDGYFHFHDDETRHDLLTGLPVDACQTPDPADRVDTGLPHRAGPCFEQVKEGHIALRNDDDTLWYCGDIPPLVPENHMTQLCAVSRTRLRFVDRSGRAVPLAPYCGAEADHTTMRQLQDARNRAARSMEPPFARATLMEWSTKRLLTQLGQWQDVPGHALDTLLYLDRVRDLGQRGIHLLSAEQVDPLIKARWYLDLQSDKTTDTFIRVLSLVTVERFMQILHEIVDPICASAPDTNKEWLRRGHKLMKTLESQGDHKEMTPEIKQIFARLPPLPPTPVLKFPILPSSRRGRTIRRFRLPQGWDKE
nr:DUF4062 domain-containing protein [Gluconacetobacter entanii]